MKFLGIEIERKTDILAMAAFLISIGSIVSQVALLLRGAEVGLDGPGQIVLFFGEQMRGERYLNAITTQIYVNRGTPGYDDILRSETLHFQIGNREIQLQAQYSVQSTRKGDNLVIQNKVPWAPVKIRAGDFVSNEILYVPRISMDKAHRNVNFITFRQLIESLQRSKQVKITLEAKTYGGETLTAECFLSSGSALQSLRNSKWFVTECFKANGLDS